MRISRLLAPLLLWLVCCAVQAQELVTIRGRVTDASDHSGLPQASVSLSQQLLGTATNEDGYFMLRLPATATEGDLVVSYVGFESVRVPLQQALAQRELEVALPPSPQLLTEVVVKPVQGLALVQEAISRIPENYPSSPMLLEAFYRETVRQEDTYLQLTEAVLQIYKDSYKNKSTGQVKVRKGRQLENRQADRVTLNLMGGPTGSNSMDLVAHRAAVLDPAQMPLYTYTHTGMTTYEGRPVYVVAVDQKDKVKKPLLKGELYIDQESMAFVSFHFGLSPKGRKYLNEMSFLNDVKAKLAGVKMETQDKHYQVHYRLHQGKWYLHQNQGQITFLIRQGRQQPERTFRMGSEMLVTSAQSQDVQRFSEDEVLRSREQLTQHLGTYDPEFWARYTILEPSQAVQRVAEQLQQHP